MTGLGLAGAMALAAPAMADTLHIPAHPGAAAPAVVAGATANSAPESDALRATPRFAEKADADKAPAPRPARGIGRAFAPFGALSTSLKNVVAGK